MLTLVLLMSQLRLTFSKQLKHRNLLNHHRAQAENVEYAVCVFII